jgi:Skp family chaperone for outer membrane proteins
MPDAPAIQTGDYTADYKTRVEIALNTLENLRSGKAKELQALPEYVAFASAVKSLKQKQAEHDSASHPVSEMPVTDWENKKNELEKTVEQTQSSLGQRVLQEVGKNETPELMIRLQNSAYQAAQASIAR